MVKERITEIIDFATSTSPYKNANKGWLTEDVYLQLGAKPQKSSKQGKQFLDVFVFWKPIKELVVILFFAVSLASILVVSSISYAHGNLHFSFSLPSITSKPIELQEDVQEEIKNMPVVEDNQSSSLELSEIEEIPIKNEVQESISKTQEEIEIQPKTQKSLGSAGNLF